MMGFVFTIMIVSSILISVLNGNSALVIEELTRGANSAVELMLSLCGSYILWMGIMNVARQAGLVDRLARLMQRPLRLLMPNVGGAAAPITMNLAANFFGLGNAATPFGLEAMRQLSADCSPATVASANVCMFLALNSSAIELLPTSVIAVRAACGSANSMIIALPTFLSSVCAAIAAVLCCKGFASSVK